MLVNIKFYGLLKFYTIKEDWIEALSTEKDSEDNRGTMKVKHRHNNDDGGDCTMSFRNAIMNSAGCGMKMAGEDDDTDLCLERCMERCMFKLLKINLYFLK